MKQWIDFLREHWLLAGLFLGFLAALVVNERFGLTSRKKISPQALVSLMNHRMILILDVRPEELFKRGHILGAQQVTFPQMMQNELFFQKIKKYQQHSIVVVGSSDSEAEKVQGLLRKKGFAQTYLLQGGLLAWQRAAMPLVKA